MYLKQLFLENSGPLRGLQLDLAFTEDGAPKPLVLVGANGGGKTNLLSLVADALFEAAAAHYDNVLPTTGAGRSWFRMVGGRTTTVGAPGGYTLLQFEHLGQDIIYKEKAGSLAASEIVPKLPAHLAGAVDWPTDGSIKQINLSDEQSRSIFEEGVFVYFPSSRSEIPYWLNRDSIAETEFDVFAAFAKRLRKPIFVQRSLHQFKQWLISVILDARAHIGLSQGPGGEPELQVQSDVNEALLSSSVLAQCNLVLQLVLDDDQVRFAWLGRKSPDKLAVAKANDLLLPSLDALSGGQSALLGMFGTLLRYGDQSRAGSALDLASIEGICIVDEIDSHIHVDLQNRTLPALIRLFPRVQFILSSHSPLFVIGMERVFTADGFQLIEMPAGNAVTAETYSEFGKAMAAVSATSAFNEKLFSEAAYKGLPIIFVEGETDAPYLRHAAEVLGRSTLLDRCEIQWIGAKDAFGQGFHTGKTALDHTFNVLRANPKLVHRPLLLLYDNDAKKSDVNCGIVSVRSMPTNEENSKVKAGIENLLSESSITEGDYQSTETLKPNGDLVSLQTLRKAELCRRMCEHGTSDDFGSFGSVLDTIEAFLGTIALQAANEAGSGSANVGMASDLG